MRIRWTPAAASDLEEISNYLKDRHPSYWQPTILKLYEEIRSLKQFPIVDGLDVRKALESCRFPLSLMWLFIGSREISSKCCASTTLRVIFSGFC